MKKFFYKSKLKLKIINGDIYIDCNSEDKDIKKLMINIEEKDLNSFINKIKGYPLVLTSEVDFSLLKLKKKNNKPREDYKIYNNTLTWKFQDKIVDVKKISIYYKDKSFINFIRPLCDCIFVHNTLWYPKKPDELTNYKNKYFYGEQNNIKYPIYIISKGRWDIKGTAKYLDEMKIKYKLVIEPKEKELYLKFYDESKLLITPENFSEKKNGGIPVRNWVWEYSLSQGEKKHWILDDNIYGWYRIIENQKIRIKSPLIFSVVEEFTDRFTNVKMSGHNYTCFSFGFSPITLNTRVYSSILLSNDIYPEYAWRGKYNEDTDLSLRLLKAGYPTILFNTLTAQKAQTMTCKGGNTDTIYQGSEAHYNKSKELYDNHPDCVKIVKRFNRMHHLVNYNKFKNLKLEYKTPLLIEQQENNYLEYDLRIKENK